jgi:hypothetical protein
MIVLEILIRFRLNIQSYPDGPAIKLVQIAALSDAVVLGVVGLVINIIWVLIQYRSSKYIEYCKKQAQTYKSSDTPDIYPPNPSGFALLTIQLP